MTRAYRVLLIGPGRQPLEITERVSDLGSIAESVEDTLLSLSHSDLSLTIADQDGFLWGLLGRIDPDEQWIVHVHRTTGQRKPKWVRVFGGVIDLPWSLSRDMQDGTLELQVFSFSKMLERASAENVRRTFAALTGSITAATTTLTLSSTSGIVRNDIVTLDNGAGTTETFTISSVTNATTAVTTVAASNTFSSALATVETPYYRDVTPAALAASLLTAAGFSTDSLSVSGNVSPIPVPTPVSESGSTGFSGGRSLHVASGSLIVTRSVSPRQNATSPTAGWTAGAATTIGVVDWSPYYMTDPGAYKSLQSALGFRDDGTQLARYNSGTARIYELVRNATVLIIDDDLGSILATIDTTVSGGYSFAHFEYDPVNDGIWTSYKRANGTREALEYYDFTTTTQTDLGTGAGTGGRLRCCRALNAMIVHTGATFRVYDLVTKLLTQVVVLPAEAAKLAMWTLRYFDGFVAVTGQDEFGRGSFVYFWDQAWTYRGRYRLVAIDQGLGSAPGAGLIPYCTPFTLSDGKQVLIVNASGTMLVLSTRYDGVIPYADGADKSCAALLTEVAGLLIQTLDVTPYGIVRLKPRNATTDPRMTLAEPLDADEQPLWDEYRTSFEVTGKDVAGNDVEYISGDTGDSARRGSREIGLAITAGMAQTIAEAAQQFLGQKRRQIDGTWAEGTQQVRPFDVVRFRTRKWIALEVETDLQDEEQDLRLVSAD